MKRVVKLTLLALSYGSIQADISGSIPAPQPLNDDILDQTINLMAAGRKSPHLKEAATLAREEGAAGAGGWPDFDFDVNLGDDSGTPDFNRVKRKTKRNAADGPKIRERPHHYLYPQPMKDRYIYYASSTTKKPSILPDHMNPGVVFRVRMSDAILRIKQRMYEDPEIHMEADIVYTNLIKKVVMDEINKFHNLLLMYKTDKSIKEHLGECGGRIFKFISYMTIKVHIYCLFDALWIDGNPYVIGDEYTVTPVEMPPMLQCDAAECNSVVFVDSKIDQRDLNEADE